jgi:hypothetical protein
MSPKRFSHEFSDLTVAGSAHHFSLTPMLKSVASVFLLMLAFLVTPVFAQNALTLPEGTVGTAYGPVRLGVDRAIGGLMWRQPAAGGTLLSDIGLTLNAATGELSGTPSKAGTFTFQLEAYDPGTPTVRGLQIFSLTINEALRIVLPQTPPPTRTAAAPAAAPTPDKRGSNSDELTISVSNEFNPGGLINIGTLAIVPGQEANLIDGLLKAENLALEDYCIVHLVKWQAAAGKEGGAKFDSQDRWYLYQKVQDPKNNANTLWELQEKYEGARIFGSRRVAALLIHLRALPTWDIKYGVKVTEKLPTPLQNVLDLAGVVASRAGRAGATDKVNLWGGQLLNNIKDLPADIAFKGNVLFLDANGESAQQAKEYGKTYDNEGRYRWDVSVGMPVKSFKEVQYDASNGKVTPRTTERQNAYGFLNLFFNPNGVDLKSDTFLSTPHLVMGVPISGKPLDRPMVGLGFGFYKMALKFNFFGGAVFNRVREPRTLQVGDPASEADLEADFRTRRVTKFIFGINLPIRQFKEALTKK